MRSLRPSAAEELARALGADRVVSLERLPNQGPLDLLELRAEVQRRGRAEPTLSLERLKRELARD